MMVGSQDENKQMWRFEYKSAHLDSVTDTEKPGGGSGVGHRPVSSPFLISRVCLS